MMWGGMGCEVRGVLVRHSSIERRRKVWGVLVVSSSFALRASADKCWLLGYGKLKDNTLDVGHIQTCPSPGYKTHTGGSRFHATALQDIISP